MKTIQEIRKNLNMSLSEFSKHFEIPYNTVRQWENGERKAPPYVLTLIEKTVQKTSQKKIK